MKVKPSGRTPTSKYLSRSTLHSASTNHTISPRQIPKQEKQPSNLIRYNNKASTTANRLHSELKILQEKLCLLVIQNRNKEKLKHRKTPEISERSKEIAAKSPNPPLHTPQRLNKIKTEREVDLRKHREEVSFEKLVKDSRMSCQRVVEEAKEEKTKVCFDPRKVKPKAHFRSITPQAKKSPICTFSPRIDTKSKKLATEIIKSKSPVEQRLHEYAEKKEAARIDRVLSMTPTFTPIINPRKKPLKSKLKEPPLIVNKDQKKLTKVKREVIIEETECSSELASSFLGDLKRLLSTPRHQQKKRGLTNSSVLTKYLIS